MTARKVDELELLRLFSKGVKAAQIARDLGITRQAVGLYKPLLLEVEQLSQQKFGRKFHKLTDDDAASLLQSVGRKVVTQRDVRIPTWDEVREFVLTNIDNFARVKILERELADTKRELELATSSSKKRKSDERRYELALKQGEVNPPLSRTNEPNLTYHISLYERQSLLNSPFLDNIIFIDGQPTLNIMLCDIIWGGRRCSDAEVSDKTICWQREGNPGSSQLEPIRPQDNGLSWS